MTPQTKLGKDLQVGDKVILSASGTPVKITDLSPGMARHSRLAEWRGDGWATVFDDNEYEIQQPKTQAA